VKAEYLFVDLRKAGCDTLCNLPLGSDVSLTTNIVRAGLNYRF
jgi:opacity protein-like surface antigen